MKSRLDGGNPAVLRTQAEAGHTDTTIDVLEPCPDWRQALVDPAALCRTAARAALAAGAPGLAGAELSIVLGDDALLRRLNKEWRDKDAPTNVLSFPAQDCLDKALTAALPGVPLPLGDVVLGFDTVRRETIEQGKALRDHLVHLTVHGVLHLLGLDHEEAAEAERMETLERAVLQGLGIEDPYEPRGIAAEAQHG